MYYSKFTLFLISDSPFSQLLGPRTLVYLTQYILLFSKRYRLDLGQGAIVRPTCCSGDKGGAVCIHYPMQYPDMWWQLQHNLRGLCRPPSSPLSERSRYSNISWGINTVLLIAQRNQQDLLLILSCLLETMSIDDLGQLIIPSSEHDSCTWHRYDIRPFPVT